MIERRALLADLQAAVEALEDDIRARVGAVPELADELAAAHSSARAAGRTAMSFEEWQEGEVTQAAVAWRMSRSSWNFVTAVPV